MKMVVTLIIVIYALLVFLSGLSAIKKAHIPKIYSLSVTLLAILLGLFASFSKLYLLGLDFLLISLITWKMSPYLSERRHLSHHLIRFLLHALLWVLLFYQ